jgi:hypothetical protein
MGPVTFQIHNPNRAAAITKLCEKRIEPVGFLFTTYG